MQNAFFAISASSATRSEGVTSTLRTTRPDARQRSVTWNAEDAAAPGAAGLRMAMSFPIPASGASSRSFFPLAIRQASTSADGRCILRLAIVASTGSCTSCAVRPWCTRTVWSGTVGGPLGCGNAVTFRCACRGELMRPRVRCSMCRL